MKARLSFLVILVVLSGVARAGQPDEIADGIRVVSGTFSPGAQPDGNSVLLSTDDGLVIVDSGRHPSHTQRLLDAVERSRRSPAAIINTHWHLDHVSGNSLLRSRYPEVRVFATGAVVDARGGFLSNYRTQLTDMIARTEDAAAKAQFEEEVARIDGGDAFLPTDIVDRDRVVSIGGRRLELHVANRAVTAADLWLRDAKSGIVIAGDLVTLPVPFLDTACPAGWTRALDAIAGEEFDLLVPGHGPPLKRSGFEAYRKAFVGLLRCAAGDAKGSACVDAWIRDVGELLSGDDEPFTRTLADYYVGVLRSRRLESNCADK